MVLVYTSQGITNAAVLYFAKNPKKHIVTSSITCAHFKGDERINILDKKGFNKGIIGNIEHAIEYISERVPVEFIIKSLKRDEYPLYPLEAYREAIVNAIVHRDFREPADIIIEKRKSALEISNPGGLLNSFPIKDFGKRSWPRNRMIADILSRTRYMEKMGTGISRIIDNCKQNENIVEINRQKDFFSVVINSNEKETTQESSVKSSVKSLDVSGLSTT